MPKLIVIQERIRSFHVQTRCQRESGLTVWSKTSLEAQLGNDWCVLIHWSLIAAFVPPNLIFPCNLQSCCPKIICQSVSSIKQQWAVIWQHARLLLRFRLIMHFVGDLFFGFVRQDFFLFFLWIAWSTLRCGFVWTISAFELWGAKLWFAGFVTLRIVKGLG